ncbi:MAG: LysM peptidoglycan-binding domain-containing protein [Bacilli bacterium]|nr:LysM peptidoglycan-binding domain-containing protein [Bacilli bacterium]
MPRHGGEDPGAISGNLKEKDLNLKASLYMYDRLKDLGIDAKLTRDSDIYLPRGERIKKVKELYNNKPNVLLISNHINAGGGEGAEIVYALRSNPELANLALENIGKAGQITRGIYQRVLPENPSKDYYYILRESGNVEPMLVEYGFIDNKKDSEKLTNNLTDYVEGVVKAIAEYVNVPYTPPVNNKDTNNYTVQKGDTLYSIANKYNLTVDSLKKINNLTSNEIFIGQVLNIKPIQSNTYIVQRGDNLYSIAKNYNVSVEDLKEVNNLNSNILFIGQELLIPSEVIVEEDLYDIYEVVQGDSLWKISKRYNIPVEELIKINNLTNINLQVGDKLLVPKKEEEIYTVVTGDTLWSIAKKYNVTVADLKNKNNITNNLLSIGQQLIIP